MGRKAVSYLLFNLAIVLTAGLLVLAVVCRYASFVSPEQGRVWVQLAFATPLVLLVNGAALVFWLVKHRWFIALLPIVALIVNFDFISAMIQLPRWRERPDPELTVATLNVHGFREYDLHEATVHAVSELMRREGADVVCLQEFGASREDPIDSVVAQFGRFLPYNVHEGAMAVFSRYPVLDKEYRLFPDSGNSCLRVDVDVDGRTVRIVSVHLQTSGISMMRQRYRKDYGEEMPVDVVFDLLENNGRMRAQQARAIREMIDRSDMPVVLAGDFNDMPSSYTYRTLSEGLTDAFRSDGSGYGSTYRYFKGLLRIDYIFYNDFFEGTGYRILRERVSDHRPVVARLRFRTAEAAHE